jgi:hypothetical protein
MTDRNANVHQLFRPLLNAISQPTLAEQSTLELMHNGPIPARALSDLRAMGLANERVQSRMTDDDVLALRIDCAKSRVESCQQLLDAERRAFRKASTAFRSFARPTRRQAISPVWERYARAHADTLSATAHLIDLLREQSRRTVTTIQHAAE